MNNLTTNIPIAKIYRDNHFNCRGEHGVDAFNVVELSNNIKAHGVLQPIIVRTKLAEEKADPNIAKFDYMLVAGYRRTLACEVAGLTEIPATVRDDLDHATAALINLSENLSREDLNILQEAITIEKLIQAGISNEKIAKQLGKSNSWVNIRIRLRKLPEAIQKESATGIFSEHHINSLARLETPEQQIQVAKEIKQHIERGVKKSNIKVGETPEGPTKQKVRQKGDIQLLINFLLNKVGTSITTVALAWCNGNATNKELWDELEKLQTKTGKKLSPPQDYRIPDVTEVPMS